MKKIVLTSTNPTKLTIIKRVVTKLLPNEQFEYVTVSGKKEQGEIVERKHIFARVEELLKDARNQNPEADYYVVMQGGVEDDGNVMEETAYATIENKEGKRATSSCSTFRVPTEVANIVRSGKTFLEAVNEHFKTTETEQKGFVNILTNGLMTKEDHYYQPSLIAFSTLQHPEWYL